MARRGRERRGKKRQDRQITWSDSKVPHAPDHIPRDIGEAHQLLSEVWGHCDDVEFRWFHVAGHRAFLVWINSLIGKELTQEGILKPLTEYAAPLESVEQLQNVLHTVTVQPKATLEEINRAIGEGMAVLCLDGFAQGVAVDVKQFQGRQVERAELEPVVRGPQEAFTENLDINLGLVRRRLKSPRVKVEYIFLGTVSHTRIALVYIEGIVKPGFVEECRKRLDRIHMDSILDSNYVEEMIDDAPLSPFPTIEYTERPDRLSAELLQGRIGILVDGSPDILMLPATFVNFLQSPEDYFQRYTAAVAVRLLRYFYFWLALLLPSTYVALLSYHQEMIPTPLLITLVASHEGVPFPAFVEALVMEVTFEALREAGIRLPRAVGQSVSIVGALVIGEAAVNAGIVSPAIVIIVALTGIASFTIPSYNLGITLRILRFPFMVLAGVFGMYGIMIALLLVWIHMVSLRSLGVPYMSPIAPLIWPDLKDALNRPPWWQMRKRPKTMEPVDLTRSEHIPRPLPGRTEGEPS
ncbi:MAG: spore germination protein [Alicyclobacillaceae bacterium]|nr:spore germination protein [Alicyclobacillaceae bacterium]